MSGGYTAKYLDVDLSSGGIGEVPLSAEEALPFIGGKGVAALLLHRLLPRGADPLSLENVVVINTGPLTATGTPGSSRFNLSTKSPLTGLIATSNCGGRFGLYLKRAGYDGLIIRGKAPGPVWLDIGEEGAALKDASGLWGKGALEVQRELAGKQGSMAIGPAGENLVRFACVMSGERALARCGVGAVLGSKNLKGATARGNRKAPVSDEAALGEVKKAWAEALRSHPVTGTMLSDYGTSVLLNRTNAVSLLPTRNFTRGAFDAADEISGESLEELVVTHDGCYACPVRCGRVVENPCGDGRVKGPEYETLAMLGSNLENPSLPHIIEWNYLCDELGMDTISAGAVLGTAMELAARGSLECDLRFGETSGVARTLEDMAYRRGLGDLLAEGALRLAEERGAPEIAPHCKGLELPGYHPRSAFGHALGYATANRGGCHLNGGYLAFFEGAGNTLLDPHEWRGKASMTVLMQNLLEAVSSSGGCSFSAFIIFPSSLTRLLVDASIPFPVTRLLTHIIRSLRALDYLPKRLLAFRLPASYLPFLSALEAVTGERFSLGRFLEAGERVFNLERLFNLREGMDPRAADTLPGRMTGEEKTAEGQDVPLERMLPAYYRARGWDANGRPKPKTLKRLGLYHTLG